MKLSELKVGESGVVIVIKLSKIEREHLFTLGVKEGEIVTVSKKSLFGSPTLVKVSDYYVALQEKTLNRIEVKI